MAFDLVKKLLRGALARFEPIALPGTAGFRYPPLFIVGPPRSGTTLLYLLLAHRFRVSYISNYLAMTPASPVLLGRLAKLFQPFAGPGDFSNHYGETQGWRAPNQGYRVWNQWLPTDTDYIAPGSISTRTRWQLRQIVAGIEAINDAPFVNKWQRNAARIEALNHIFPEALFLRVTRDHAQVAQSLLKGRMDLNGGPEYWFSTRPVDMPDPAGLSPIEQVCYQAVGIDRQVASDLARLGPDRSFCVSYEGLCADPAGNLDRLAEWYAGQSGRPLRVDDLSLPTLRANSTPKVSAEDAAEIERVCARLMSAEAAL